MSFIVKQLIKYGISVLDKENITQDQIEYVYKKWGLGVAERVVKLVKGAT